MRNVFQEVYLLNALLKITTLTFLTNTMMDRERWLKLTEQLHFSFAWMCVEYFYFKEELLNFFIMSWCSCSRGNNFTKWARGGCTFWGLWPFFFRFQNSVMKIFRILIYALVLWLIGTISIWFVANQKSPPISIPLMPTLKCNFFNELSSSQLQRRNGRMWKHGHHLFLLLLLLIRSDSSKSKSSRRHGKCND